MDRQRWLVAALLGLVCMVSATAGPPAPGGPALWRVAHGDHELVVLGSLVPLPESMEWNQAPVAALLDEAQALLEPPGVDLEGRAAWLVALWRLPGLLRARNNPADRTLQDVLPASLFQRWERMRLAHLGGRRAVQWRRPIVAADTLQRRAMKQFGFDLDNQIAEQVARLARRRGVERVETALPLRVDTLEAFLDAVAQQPFDDQRCFEQILARVEAGPERLLARAEAWREGALAELLAEPLGDTFALCASALLDHPAAHQHGLDNLPGQARERWLEVAEQSLRQRHRSVAVLPLSLVVGEAGYLAELQRRGFRVEPPLSAIASQDGGLLSSAR